MLGLSLGWQAAAEIGVFATVLIVLAWRLPNIIEACAKLTKVILKYRVDKDRVPAKIKAKKSNLAKKIEDKTKAKGKSE